jgi:hypothetical protein
MLAFAAERAVKGFFAGRAFFLGHGGNALLVTESCRDDNEIENGVFPGGKTPQPSLEVIRSAC